MLPRLHQAADEEDRSRTRIADQEDKRVIGAEDNRLFGHAHGGGAHGDASSGGRLGALLRYINERLVDDFRDRQRAFRVDAREIRLVGKARGHAHSRECLAQRELRFGAELRQADLHVPGREVAEPASQRFQR